MNEAVAPQATIIGNANQLIEKFERVEGGWLAYKTFNGMYKTPSHWNIEPLAIITNGVDINITDTCSFGINVGPSVTWVKDFIADIERDEYGNTQADIWKLFIPDSATIVIPEHSNGKIRVSEAKLIGIVDQGLYWRGISPDYFDEYNDDDDDDDYDDDDF